MDQDLDQDKQQPPQWMPARRPRRLRMGFLLKAVCAVLCVGVLGGAVMLLWNWVVPPIFPGAAAIGFWRALGLLVLCRILFGGFRGRHGGWHEKKRRMRERWQAMTPEERERFESRMCMFGRRRAERRDE
ncbi:hypothetical protein [Herbaspirillum robiniae]|uniref:Uncharacterized protein n=1 Tax=Herbaspirillum robiniae TaxID=2014887 RepID=A0A246WVW0_9BURK|nr:hypothetical protein [Herbaspirillum robiniae]OWY31205.1 hypothetical protein CEJ42_03905 [Herbaspirillum robiniae]